MSAFPNPPKFLEGGLVVPALSGSAVRSVISLQDDPDTITESSQLHGVRSECHGEKRGEIEQPSQTRYAGDLVFKQGGERLT
jgi:hypothetical protein